MDTSGERPPPYRRVFVDSDENLAAILPELLGLSVIAVDIEMGQRVRRKPGGIQEWEHILALIQLAGGGLSVVVDPLRCTVAPLRPLMSGTARKVFLGGGQDAALLERAGIPAIHIVDVGEIAYALYGRREDGMAALCRRIFGISLDKTVRRADWMARPINPTLLSYAYHDAELTLGTSEWFQAHHPDIVRFHQRRELDPAISPSAPPWLREVLERSSGDAFAVLMALDIDPERDAERLAEEMRPVLHSTVAPRLLNKVVRLASDLRLAPLLPDILPLADSPSSLIRASAARGIGMLATPEQGEARLTELAGDPIEDVRKSAQAGLRELKSTRATADPGADETEAPSLDDNAMAALAQLKARLESS